MEECPNWLEMPDELMANILERLGAQEILYSTWAVCTTWWRICQDPAIWKVIDVRNFEYNMYYDIEMLTKAAVDLSRGELIDISIEDFGTDDLLDYIVLRSSKLKSLCIGDYNRITGSGLIRAVRWVPQLEKLHLTDISISLEDIEVIGRNCPLLKSFQMTQDQRRWTIINCDNHAFAIVKNMPKLCHLQMLHGEMTEVGLKAILSGCLHLVTLHICTLCKLDGDLKKLTIERMKNGNLKQLTMGKVLDDDYYEINDFIDRMQREYGYVD